MPHSVTSDQGLHCLLYSVCANIRDKYGKMSAFSPDETNKTVVQYLSKIFEISCPIIHVEPGQLALKKQFNLGLQCSSPASVAQLDAPSDWIQGGRGFNPRRGRQHSFVEIDHEIFSTVILSLPLIQEGQLSVSGERMCTILVNRLED